MTAIVQARPPTDIDHHPDQDLLEYCRPHLSSLSRSDQRKWGEAYVRGLVTVPGRKSIRRIADQVAGRPADQSLQQFVNQSTWQCEPVRCSLAEQVTRTVRPRAWVALEIVFPKNGSNSVGVARQYIPAAGRVVNCQVGLAVFLAGAESCCPVNWRLLLPPSWDGDPARRIRTRLPDHQRHLPRWHHLINSIDQMTAGWRLAPAPLLFDATHEPNLEPRLRSLEQRRLHYLVRVPGNAPATRWHGGGPTGRTPTVAEIAAQAERSGAEPVTWQNDDERRPARIVTAVVSRSDDAAWSPRRSGSPPQQLVVSWPAAQPAARSFWLTNFGRAGLPQLAELVALHAKAVDGLQDMEDTVGLQHFEGRSFPGWHHHVTLASMAYAYTLTVAAN